MTHLTSPLYPQAENTVQGVHIIGKNYITSTLLERLFDGCKETKCHGFALISIQINYATYRNMLVNECRGFFGSSLCIMPNHLHMFCNLSAC